MDKVYLVLQYDHRLVYLPFKKLEYIDEFTIGFEDKVALCEAISKYLDLGIPREECLDAYISETIKDIKDDTQEFSKRYLGIQYSHNNYNLESLIEKLCKFMAGKIEKMIRVSNLTIPESDRQRKIAEVEKEIAVFSGLDIVIKNFRKKRDKASYSPLKEDELTNIATAYLGTDYRRKKEVYFRLKDMGYKIKNNRLVIDPTKTSIALEDEDRDNLCWFVDMNLDTLKQYVASEDVTNLEYVNETLFEEEPRALEKGRKPRKR